jgi:hypothetical protein
MVKPGIIIVLFLFYFCFVKSEEFRRHRESPYYCYGNQHSPAAKPWLTTFHKKINTLMGIRYNFVIY